MRHEKKWESMATRDGGGGGQLVETVPEKV